MGVAFPDLSDLISPPGEAGIMAVTLACDDGILSFSARLLERGVNRDSLEPNREKTLSLSSSCEDTDVIRKEG